MRPGRDSAAAGRHSADTPTETSSPEAPPPSLDGRANPPGGSLPGPPGAVQESKPASRGTGASRQPTAAICFMVRSSRQGEGATRTLSNVALNSIWFAGLKRASRTLMDVVPGGAVAVPWSSDQTSLVMSVPVEKPPRFEDT